MKSFQEFVKTLDFDSKIKGQYQEDVEAAPVLAVIINESEYNSIVEMAEKRAKISTLEEVVFKLKGDGSSTARWIANDFESELNKLKG